VSKYLLSGLLVCGQCGSKFVVVSRTSYGCAGHVNGRLCQNNLLARRDPAEDLLLSGIRDDLLTAEIDNLANAIASGLLRSSTALADRLARCSESPNGGSEDRRA
jgi:hypothetical protein